METLVIYDWIVLDSNWTVLFFWIGLDFIMETLIQIILDSGFSLHNLQLAVCSADFLPGSRKLFTKTMVE
jgi:hypothetical protein